MTQCGHDTIIYNNVAAFAELQDFKIVVCAESALRNTHGKNFSGKVKKKKNQLI